MRDDYVTEPRAVEAFGALANEHRLAIFRLLMRRGPSGMPAGEIAAAVGVSPSNLSFHIAQLERAGLLRSWRVKRSIHYAADIEGTRRLLTFLTEECCDRNPAVCGGLLSAARLLDPALDDNQSETV